MIPGVKPRHAGGTPVARQPRVTGILSGWLEVCGTVQTTVLTVSGLKTVSPRDRVLLLTVPGSPDQLAVSMALASIARNFTPKWSPGRNSQTLGWTGVVLTLLVAWIHAWYYRFLTDDAFIAFGYARAVAEGNGFTFHPEADPVEGYTSFLWVCYLALIRFLGGSIEQAALLTGFALTAILWFLVARFLRDEFGLTHGLKAACAGLLLLALNRSFAVWTTGGLETRLFECLAIGGVIMALSEERRMGAYQDESSASAHAAPRPWSTWLLSLAVLARPEGWMVAAGTLGSLLVFRWHFTAIRTWFLRASAIVAVVSFAHLSFRVAYHGDLLPNTWYAKVDGFAWSEGAKYVLLFVLEYSLWIWVPLALLGALGFARRSRSLVPIVCAAAFLPYALSTVAIGGDHFEFRPFDIQLPIACLFVGAGLATLASGALATSVSCALAVALPVIAFELPLRAHLDFPATYHVGYPGFASEDEKSDFLRVDRGWVHCVPPLCWLAQWHRNLLDDCTGRFIGIRQEEHALFQREAEREASLLGRRIHRGTLPPQTHIALDCVGTIGYRTGLRVFDRLGLTNRQVARSAPVRRDLNAHTKYATLEQAAFAGVELWSIHALHLHWKADNPAFRDHLYRFQSRGEDVSFAEVEPGLFLMAWSPNGTQGLRAKHGRLRWQSTRTFLAVQEVSQR